MIYYVGLIFVILLILVSLDDFFWDLYYFFRIKRKHKAHVVDYQALKDTVPGILAIIVAAYSEEDVLEDVIENLIKSNHYPKAMYHIFLGVYPNDPPTLEVAERLSNRHRNVHKIVHVLDGPSSKADNINNVIENILAYEDKRNIKFKGIVIHDSEDVVHPYEFLIENYLLNRHKAIQMPVFPLQEMPRFRNIFKNMVSGTYADEFAENHYSMLVSRNAMDSFVPSAGTGFTLSRDIIDSFDDFNVFPVGSLTEDYKLSLQLKEKGFNLHYALEEVERIKSDGKVSREFIATRSMFPNTYKAAVRQKTRWIYGITMQSFEISDIFKSKNLSFASKYSLYKDWKAKFGNLFLGPGYLVFSYFIASIFLDIPVMFPTFSFSWYLMILVTLMMIQRQYLRGRAIKNVYGFKSVFISVLFPPILPIRMVLGNIINFHATLRAWRTNLLSGKVKKQSKNKKKKPAWSKTDHEFLDEQILKRFRRTLGDILFYESLISQAELNKALKKAKEEKLRLGEYLIREKIVSEENVLMALGKIDDRIYIKIKANILSGEWIKIFGKEFLLENHIAPIIKTSKGIVFAISNPDKEEIIREKLEKKDLNQRDIKFIYSDHNIIDKSLKDFDANKKQTDQVRIVEMLIEDGSLTIDEGILALRYGREDIDMYETLSTMGFMMRIQEVKEA